MPPPRGNDPGRSDFEPFGTFYNNESRLREWRVVKLFPARSVRYVEAYLDIGSGGCCQFPIQREALRSSRLSFHHGFSEPKGFSPRIQLRNTYAMGSRDFMGLCSQTCYGRIHLLRSPAKYEIQRRN